MHLPEKVVAGTHNTELEFKRRLKAYNDLADDSHPAKFFEDVDRPGETMSKWLFGIRQQKKTCSQRTMLMFDDRQLNAIGVERVHTHVVPTTRSALFENLVQSNHLHLTAPISSTFTGDRSLFSLVRNRR
jgi:hypothetical protein